MKLVKKVGDFLRDVTQLVKCQPSPVTSAHPNQCFDATKHLVGDVTQPLCTGPDIAADAEAAATVWIVALPPLILPPLICSQRSFHYAAQITCLILPVVRFEALIPIIDSRCASVAEIKHYYLSWCINAYYYICVPWNTLPIRRAVSFRWACVISVLKADSR